MSSSAILALYLVLFVLQRVVENGLGVLNLRHGRAQDAPPPALAGAVDGDTHARMREYTQTRGRFALLTDTVAAVAVLAVVLSGVLGTLDRAVGQLALHPYLSGGIYVLAVGAFFTVIGIPAALYSQFVIEERFGFNRTTLRLFLLDRLKGGLISLVISAIVLLVLFAFMDRAGSLWWLYAGGVIIAFQFVLMVLYPTVIAPLFNRFVPVGEGEVRTRLAELARRLGYRLRGIFVMDGSKRSKHSNAYFTGLGPVKRIVLFDTLLDQLDPGEIEAVVAHEIGHERLRHIPQRLALSVVATVAALWVLSLVLDYAPLFAAFGIGQPSHHAALVLFSLLAGPFTFWLGPLSALWSRRHEYAADRFAATAVESPEPLSGALIKLSRDNLSNLAPHPWYSFYHYSHPTLVERLAALQAA